MRCINIEAGTVVNMAPNTKVVIGKVAQPGEGAMFKPTSPAVANTVMMHDEYSACATASSRMVRFDSVMLSAFVKYTLLHEYRDD